VQYSGSSRFNVEDREEVQNNEIDLLRYHPDPRIHREVIGFPWLNAAHN
jgi:hypothetical protein